MDFARRLYAFRELVRITGARLRVHAVRLQGGRHIHPKCLFGRGVRVERPWLAHIGTRCMLQPEVWLNVGADSARLDIGEYTFIGRGTEIEVAQHVSIGRGCLIAPGVFITDHNHGTVLGTPMFRQKSVIEPVHIEDDVWIGANCVICAGVRIGQGAVVAAGAAVVRDVAPRTIVGGVPARLLRVRGAGAAGDGAAISVPVSY